MILEYAILTVMWLALIAYAVLGGADFGAGIWDFLAFGKRAERRRRLITQAIGPVWEANHVWLIFLLVGLFTAFPLAFSTLSTALFLPFTLILFGIVLRGAAFIFRTYASDMQWFSEVWSRVFGLASAVTPFLLGASAAAVASGSIRVQANGFVQTDLGSAWTTPFALTIGAMAVCLCAVLAAIYLTVEAERAHDDELVEVFRLRAIVAGAITAVLGAAGLLLSPSEAPLLWNGMLAHALPVVIATMLVGLGAAVALYLRRYRWARALVIVETAFLLGSWGVSQLPYIIPPDVTVSNAAASTAMLWLLLLCTIVGMLLLIPSLWFLFSVFKGNQKARST
ncbi:MAG: cytochrome d ubiquinol oxidase subunit II [Ktedonobacteraceae bacterium]|nr:cytochrome d ubiquinol oxidase subunit II [Chloroflexota bacterium]